GFDTSDWLLGHAQLNRRSARLRRGSRGTRCALAPLRQIRTRRPEARPYNAARLFTGATRLPPFRASRVLPPPRIRPRPRLATLRISTKLTWMRVRALDSLRSAGGQSPRVGASPSRMLRFSVLCPPLRHPDVPRVAREWAFLGAPPRKKSSIITPESRTM